VDVPGGSYPVWIGAGLLERARDLIPTDAERVAVIAEEHLEGERIEGLRRALGSTSVFRVTGEVSKSPPMAERAWRWLATEGLHRGDLVIGFGGGVTTDLAGFAAATYNRGVDWVAIPTTTLAMVDASIGGKTGIDLPEGKNLVGAFHHPRAVIADVSTLTTLPDDVFTTGLAEAIKHGFIADPGLLDDLASGHDRLMSRHSDTLIEVIARAAAVKVAVVGEDPTEQGVRAHLNYGHTLAHAIEAIEGYEGRTHGRAVAIGMMFAAHLADQLGMGDRVLQHRTALEAFGLPIAGARHDFDAIAGTWQRDKKYERGMRFVLLEDIGKPAVVRDVPDAALRKAYEAVA